MAWEALVQMHQGLSVCPHICLRAFSVISQRFVQTIIIILNRNAYVAANCVVLSVWACKVCPRCFVYHPCSALAMQSDLVTTIVMVLGIFYKWYYLLYHSHRNDHSTVRYGDILWYLTVYSDTVTLFVVLRLGIFQYSDIIWYHPVYFDTVVLLGMLL